MYTKEVPKLIGERMSRPPITITPDLPINEALAMFKKERIRLRFKLDDNNNTVANYLSLYSGNAPAASRPQLIIEYYLP